MRAGRIDEALGRFDEARSHLLHAGAQHDVLEVDARIAECRIVQGDADAALELTAGALDQTGTSNLKLVALVERVRGFALHGQGDATAARQALEASLAAGRTRRDSFEIAQTLRALIALDRSQGIEPLPSNVAESDTLFASLKVRNVPATPVDTR